MSTACQYERDDDDTLSHTENDDTDDTYKHSINAHSKNNKTGMT